MSGESAFQQDKGKLTSNVQVIILQLERCMIPISPHVIFPKPPPSMRRGKCELHRPDFAIKGLSQALYALQQTAGP